MHDAPAILDPRDPLLVHTDVTCADLWVLAARVEAATGRAADDPEVLLDQAHADGLLAEHGAGLRRCTACAPSARWLAPVLGRAA